MTVWEERFTDTRDMMLLVQSGKVSPEDATRFVFDLLEQARAFGSQRVATSALAALNRVLNPERAES